MGFNNYENYDRAARAAAAVASYYGGSRTKTVTKMRNNDVVQAVEPGEYTRKRRHQGRNKRPTLKRAFKLLNVSQQKMNIRWNNCNAFNSATGGALKLQNYTATAAGQRSLFPVYFVDLTSAVNNVFGTVTYANPVYTLSNDWATQNFYLDNVAGLAQSGASGANPWLLESSGALSNVYTGNTPFRSAVHKWVDIRMLAYGCTTQPTKYDITIISFPEDEFNPFYLSDINGGFVDRNTDDGATGLLQYFVHPYCYNPIFPEDPGHRKKFKTHFREQFMIQPQFSIENDTAPHMKDFRFFKVYDAIRKYDWKNNLTAQNAGGNVASAMNAPAFANEAGQVENNVIWGQRQYLMIRAISGPQATNVFSKTVNPSFDLFVRSQHRITT